MSEHLVRYEAARHALRVATQVDEVKEIRDKAKALALYAAQAKDTELHDLCNKLQLRAERRVGELLGETARAKGGRPAVEAALAATPNREEYLAKKTGVAAAPVSATLEEIGVSKHQSADFQAIASIAEDKFEEIIANGKATTASLVRASPKKGNGQSKPRKKAAPKPPPVDSVPKAEYEALSQEFEHTDKEIRGLQALVESLKKTDGAAEIEKWHTSFTQLEGRLQQCMTTQAEAVRQCKWSTVLLEKIRKALGVETNKDILPAIQKLL